MYYIFIDRFIFRYLNVNTSLFHASDQLHNYLIMLILQLQQL